MSKPSMPGYALAFRLIPITGYYDTLVDVCSTLCRYAQAYAHLQVLQCNGPEWANDPNIKGEEYSRRMESWQSTLEQREEKLEGHLARVVGMLPVPKEGALTLRLGGDPRGCTVKLLLPEGLKHFADDWQREGIVIA